MHIRSATPQDTKELIYLMKEFDDYYLKEKVFSDDFLPFWKYKNEDITFEKTLAEWFANTNYSLFIAEDENKLIGYICGQIKEKNNRILDKEGYIEDWFVVDKYRNQGVGKALYDQLIVEFRKKRCNRLGISAYTGNTKTIALYHKMGFIDAYIGMVKSIDENNE